MADLAIGLEQRLAFIQGLCCRVVGIVQFAPSAGRFVLSRTIMKRIVAPGNGAGYRPLQREAVPGDRVWSIRFVRRIPRHVRHILVSALPRGAAAHHRQAREKQGASRNQMLHNSASFCSTFSAPTSSRIAMARRISPVRFRNTRANLLSVTPSTAIRSFLPGNSRVRKNNAATVDRPPIKIVSSKQTGTNANVELSGLPPTFKGQSHMLV